MTDASEANSTLTVFPLHRFVASELVGTGANAVVFRAKDRHMKREVALKLSSDDMLAQQLEIDGLVSPVAQHLRQLIDEVRDANKNRYTILREAQLLAQVDHPNVVTVLECGEFPSGEVAIVLPYLDGGGLVEYAKTDEAWRIPLQDVLQIGRGLAALHVAGILHRDFKPDNVIFGNDGRPRIVDLGLACRLDDPEAMAEIAGTTHYMAPEVFQGRPRDVRDDVYAYTMVIYEMFYGHGPFDTLEARDAGLVLRSIRRGGMPDELHEILVRGLAPDPDQRWPDMPTILRALEQVREPRRRRRRWPWVAAGVGVAASVAIGLMLPTRAVQAEACDEIAGEFEPIWNEAIRAELVEATGSRRYGDRLQDWARRWLAVRADECEAAKADGREIRSTPCATVLRAHFEVLVSSLVAGGDGAELTTSIAELPAPEHCLDHPDDLSWGYKGWVESSKISEDTAEYRRDQLAELLQLQGLALVAGPERGRPEGVDLLQRAMELREDQLRQFGGSRELLSQAQENHARGLLAVHRAGEAIEYLDLALAAHQGEFGHATWRTRELLRQKFRALVELNQLDKADSIERAVLRFDALEKDWMMYAEDAFWIADAYEASGEARRAIAVLRAGRQRMIEHDLIAEVVRFEARLTNLNTE